LAPEDLPFQEILVVLLVLSGLGGQEVPVKIQKNFVEFALEMLILINCGPNQ
jgi:hypothetical protein